MMREGLRALTMPPMDPRGKSRGGARGSHSSGIFTEILGCEKYSGTSKEPWPYIQCPESLRGPKSCTLLKKPPTNLVLLDPLLFAYSINF